jgi:hypothetical protein
MKTKLGLISIIVIATMCITACPALEQNARDTAAALNGAITAAQSQYQTECKSNPSEKQCLIINEAIDGQNALVTASEAYCGWSVTAPPPNPGKTPCVPVKSAQAGLQTAIANANLFITEVKGVIKP